MYRLVDEGHRQPTTIKEARLVARTVPARDTEAIAQALLDHTKDKIHYVKDPRTTEVLSGMDFMRDVQAADCDEMSVYLAGLAEAVAIPARFKTVAVRNPKKMDHVFVELFIPKKGWMGADPTVMSSHLGWEPPKVKRGLVWMKGKKPMESGTGDSNMELPTPPYAPKVGGNMIRGQYRRSMKANARKKIEADAKSAFSLAGRKRQKESLKRKAAKAKLAKAKREGKRVRFQTQARKMFAVTGGLARAFGHDTSKLKQREKNLFIGEQVSGLGVQTSMGKDSMGKDVLYYMPEEYDAMRPVIADAYAEVIEREIKGGRLHPSNKGQAIADLVRASVQPVELSAQIELAENDFDTVQADYDLDIYVRNSLPGWNASYPAPLPQSRFDTAVRGAGYDPFADQGTDSNLFPLYETEDFDPLNYMDLGQTAWRSFLPEDENGFLGYDEAYEDGYTVGLEEEGLGFWGNVITSVVNAGTSIHAANQQAAAASKQADAAKRAAREATLAAQEQTKAAIAQAAAIEAEVRAEELRLRRAQIESQRTAAIQKAQPFLGKQLPMGLLYGGGALLAGAVALKLMRRK
jgi:hypothetical protein